jgi:hypothetical protein
MPKKHHKKKVRRVTHAICLALMLLNYVGIAHGQVTTGNVRGVAKDTTGALVAGANITIVDKKTNNQATTQSNSTGDFEFKNLPVGNYQITVSAQGFKSLSLNDVVVQLNQTTDVSAVLTVGQLTETVNVSAGGSELVDTTTTNLAKGFEARQVVDLAQTSTALGAGIYNLALIAPNVVSSGGVGVGTGGSVGGQRARNNNFVLDGVDNNDKSVTGPQVYISPEAVAEFSLLSNQYGAEFARSTGGQFITVTKSGTNSFHGSVFGFFQNRHLNALDTLQKAQGITRDTAITDPFANPRFDFGRFGGDIGGPIIRDKLFFFGLFERYQEGVAAGAGAVTTPTSAGFATLGTIPGLSSTNLGIFKQFVPVAPSNDAGTIQVHNGANLVDIPIGNVSIPSPAFVYNNHFVVNIDFVQSDKTQHRGRFTFNQNRSIDTAASLPVFFQLVPTDTRLFSYTLLHTFNPNWTNETRLAYRRFNFNVPSGNFTFPGLDSFPNIGLNDLGLNIGPDGNAPQFGIENNYQLVDTLAWIHGNHSLKFGGDIRKEISPQQFVQRQRGDYEFNNTDTFLHDVSAEFNERTTGISPYEGNQVLLFVFAQDDWRIKPNLTINLGLNYVYQEVPFTSRQQTLNQIASVPGLLEFNAPTSQKHNFGPRIGLAYSPDYKSGWMHKLFGDQGKSSLRVGFSMAYDVLFDNLGILSEPPEFNQTTDVGPGIPNFLANGGIKPILTPTTSAAGARAGTSAWIPDQKVPYSITYTASYQRELGKAWGIELRYLGTRGIHLITQNRINIQAEVQPGHSIPTFLTLPSASVLGGLPTAGSLFACFPNPAAGHCNVIPRFLNAGFTSNVVAFLPNGNSGYNAFSAQVTHRLANGLQGSAAYTWSHMIDDTTAEVFSTVLSPRRVEDFQNLRLERADSALDRRHRFTMALIYDLPFFNGGRNFVRAIAGGWSLAGTYSAETGEKAGVRSGIDSNLNGDNAGDRTVVNTGGVAGTASTVHGVDSNGNTVPNGSKSIVAYVANNPNAQYIQAGLGAFPTSGRNTLSLPGINNIDFSIFKNFRIREGMKVQFRVDMFNAFNHPQWVPGSVNGVEATAQTSAAATNLVTVGTASFNRPDVVFTSHPRVIQLALRFNF